MIWKFTFFGCRRATDSLHSLRADGNDSVTSSPSQLETLPDDQVSDGAHQFFAVALLQVRGLDRAADLHMNLAWGDLPGVLRHQLARAFDGDRANRNLCLDRQSEGSLLEGENAPIGRARSLGKDDQTHPRMDLADGPIEGGNGPTGLAPVHEDVPGQPEIPSQQRNPPQLALGDEPQVDRQRDEEHRDVDRGLMV